jgi:hypothetical protein
MDYYNIIISPETIKGDLVNVQYSGGVVGVYSAMTDVITSGPAGTSLLTGLTIPILIRETINDMGYYDPFDGAILQQDVVTNFLFSSTTTNPYEVLIFNTSSDANKFLELSSYLVDWGDGTSKQRITGFTPNYLRHQYQSASSGYTVTLEQTNPWGLTKVTKKINLPYKNTTIYNPKGTAYFISSIGNWSATPISYDYIFSGDAKNDVGSQISSSSVAVPYFVSGETVSRLQDLEQYGSIKYPAPGVPVIKNREIYGVINAVTSTYTGYTIQGVDYYDYSDGTSIFFVKSSGFTSDNITAEPITKREVLINVVDQPQIQSNVYIERGKNSAYERIQRLGEVDNVGDLVNYGYGFFNVEKKI